MVHPEPPDVPVEQPRHRAVDRRAFVQRAGTISLSAATLGAVLPGSPAADAATRLVPQAQEAPRAQEGSGAFQQALRSLVTDEEYRKTVESDPRRLVTDFQLSFAELGLLQSVWAATDGSLALASSAPGQGSAPRTSMRLAAPSTEENVCADADGPEWYCYCCCCCCC